MTWPRRIRRWHVIAGVGLLLAAAALASYIHDRPRDRWYQAHCTPTGDRWPCSEDNPLP